MLAHSLTCRVFGSSLATVCLAVLSSFVATHVAMRVGIDAGIRKYLEHNEMALNSTRMNANSYGARLIEVIRTDAALPSAMQLAAEDRGMPRPPVPATTHAASASFQERLRAVRRTMRCDLVAAGDAHGNLLAELIDDHQATAAITLRPGAFAGSGLRMVAGELFHVTTAPVDLGKRHLGSLTVGTRLGMGSMPGFSAAQFAGMGRQVAGDFTLVFIGIAAFTVLLAACVAAVASRMVSKPFRQLIARLVESEASGGLRPGFSEHSLTREVNQLAASFNGAARSIERSNRSLHEAYVEFVETMAEALDARDPYTGGHSDRVSDYAADIALAMHVPDEDIQIIRIGARLHDIGKIGIPDAILQKPGPLTSEEFALVKLHPQIGRRILERIGQFEKYLPIVELHHEHHNGSGYPYGLSGHEVPVGVRVVHVADVYDALTTDRSYRPAMSQEKALAILLESSGSQFDPEVVRVFTMILAAQETAAGLEVLAPAGR